MKLVNGNHSPYATRVRLVIHKLGLPVHIHAPEIPMRTPEFLARFPLGKIPVLTLDDGTELPESTVIMEYLASTLGEGRLIPEAPLARAQMNLFARYADTHLAPAGLFPIFRAMMQQQPFTELLPALYAELAKGDALLAGLPACDSRDLHLGDLALAPSIAYVVMLADVLALPADLNRWPALAHWWQWIQDDPVVGETLAEMEVAYKSFMASKK